jgi:hypothetical protein
MLRMMIKSISRTMAAAILPALLMSAAPQAIDCVAAHVNRRAITLTDIRILRAFRLSERTPPTGAALAPAEILREAIDRQVVVDIMRESFPVPREEVDARLAALKARFEPDAWRSLLAEFGVTESGIASYLESILQFERMVAIRFGQQPELTVQELQDYYDREYLPAQKSAGQEPKPMSQVLGEIEQQLRDRKRDEQISAWIKGLRNEAEIRIHQDCLQNLK